MTLVSKQPYMYYLFHTIHLPVEANKRRLTTGLVVLSVVTVVDVVVAATATAAAASATACAAFAAACAASAAACSTTGDDDVVVVVVVVATVVRSDRRRRRLWGVGRDVPVRCRVLRVGRVVDDARFSHVPGHQRMPRVYPHDTYAPSPRVSQIIIWARYQRIVQISWVVYRNDGSNTPRSSYVYGSDRVVHPLATKHHGTSSSP